MIEGLLEAFEYAIRADSPEECAKQFMIWQSRVGSALATAGMVEEHLAWTEAKKLTEFYDDDATFPAQAESMKAILVGILNKLEMVEINKKVVVRNQAIARFAKLIYRRFYQTDWTLIAEEFSVYNGPRKLDRKNGKKMSYN